MRGAATAMVLFLAAGPFLPGQAQESLEGAGITLRTRLSRTLIRVGEAFEYRVLIRHPRSIQFVTQEVVENLVLRPFQIRSSRLVQRQQGEEEVLEMVLTLASHETPGRLTIPSFNLFYYPSGVLSGDPADRQDVPATALSVPPQPLRVGSTLLGEGDALRTPVSLVRFSRREWILPGLSALLLLAAGATLVARGIRSARQGSRLEAGEDPARARAEILGLLKRLSCPDGEEPRSCLEISRLVRGFLQSRYGIPGPALTPAEIGRRLEGLPGAPAFGSEVEGLLEDCERRFFDPASRSGSDLEQLRSRALKLVESSPEASHAAG